MRDGIDNGAEPVDVYGDGLSNLQLKKWAGDELDIVNAARVSFHKESSWAGEECQSCKGTGWKGYGNLEKCQVCEGRGKVYHLDVPDAAVLRFLLRNRHGTPFEQGFVSWWQVRAPIFVFREWHRHRIGFAINEESGRYVELRHDNFVRTRWHSQTGKVGAYTYEAIEDEFQNKLYTDMVQTAVEHCWEVYDYLLSQGVAKQEAREVLNLNMYSDMRWMANARSLMNFLSLRSHPTAQEAIRLFSHSIEPFFKERMPITYSEFTKNGYIAP